MTTEVLAVVLAVVFGVAGIAKIGGAPVMRTAARHLGFGVGQYRHNRDIPVQTAADRLSAKPGRYRCTWCR